MSWCLLSVPRILTRKWKEKGPWHALYMVSAVVVGREVLVHSMKTEIQMASLVSWLHFPVSFSLFGLCFISRVRGIAGHVETRAAMWPAMCHNCRKWFSGERMAYSVMPYLIVERWCRVGEWCVILSWIVQNTGHREDVPWMRTVWGHPCLSRPSEAGREECVPRGPKAGAGAWNSWGGGTRGDSPTPWCSLSFHSRILALRGTEGAYSSHTALSLNTGFLFLDGLRENSFYPYRPL